MSKYNYIEEAEAVGLTFVERADKSYGDGYLNYSKYIVNSCGHSNYYQHTHVRRNNVKCRICLEEEYNKLANERNFDVLHKLVGVSVQMCKCRTCGYESSRSLQALRNTKTSSCKNCYELSLIKIAEGKGLTYLGISELGGVFRKFKFNKCGHIKDINATCVSIDRFECKDCITLRYKEEAKSVGIEYIENVGTEGYSKYKLSCGCIKVLRRDHVRDGSFLCDFCGDNHYIKPSNIYLLKVSKDDVSFLKLGYSINVKLRKQNYMAAEGSIIEDIAITEVSTGAKAKDIELALHRKYKKHRLNKLDCKYILKNNGHTECYPISLLDNLLQELNNIKKEKYD